MNVTLESLGITSEALLARLIESLQDAALEEGVYTDCRKALINEFRSKFADKIEAAVGEAVREVIAQSFDSVFQPVDNMGRANGDPTTVRNLIIASTTEWWKQKVDSQGKPYTNSWGQEDKLTMAAYHAKKATEEVVKGELASQLSEITTAAKKQFQDSMAATLSGMVKKLTA